MTWAYTWAISCYCRYWSRLLTHNTVTQCPLGPTVYCPVLWVLNCNMWCGLGTWQLQWWGHNLVTFIWANINIILGTFSYLHAVGFVFINAVNLIIRHGTCCLITHGCNLELQAKARFCTDSCTHAHCTNNCWSMESVLQGNAARDTTLGYITHYWATDRLVTWPGQDTCSGHVTNGHQHVCLITTMIDSTPHRLSRPRPRVPAYYCDPV